MSSLHQSHLLDEGAEPVKGDGSTLASARGTSRRPAEEKASKVPSQRQGKAQQTGTDPTIADGSTPTSSVSTSRSAGRKSAAPAVGTIAARARAAAVTKAAATGKAASAKAATATAVPSKAATAAKAKPAAKATPVAKAKPAAKATPVAKAKPAAPKATPVAAVRPTPYKRPQPVESAPAAVVVEVPEQADVVSSDMATEFLANEIVAAAAEGRRSSFLRRRPASIRRRPALFLAAALVGAISVSGFSSGDPAAQAMENRSNSVSVAEELGIAAEPTEAITDSDAAERLGELAVSRNERGAEQAAAAQVQSAADQAAAAAAAEAARPRAVFPISGARLTSSFGPRWGTTHNGLDVAAPMMTPEYAAADGVVIQAGPASGFGLAVYVQHDNGDVTVYGHMEQVLVEAGQVVRAGDTIALVGNRGQSTGPHLHFEVRSGGANGTPINPITWLSERGVDVPTG